MKRLRIMRTVALALLVSGAIVLGCGESTVVPDNTPPTACFTMAAYQRGRLCPMEMSFWLDASCTEDNFTEQRYLLMRWDFQNNGLWDTSYEEWDPYWGVVPDPSWDKWFVRLEVWDLAGNVSEYVDSMDLSFLPPEPDLMMGRLEVRQYSQGYFFRPDTILAGEPFSVRTAHSCYGGVLRVRSYMVTIYVDDVLVGERDERCDINWADCSIFSVDDIEIATPGPHEVKVVLDVDDRINEVDESNNSAVLQITVIE